MESKPMKSLDSLKVLQALIVQMENGQEENPEYVLRNIELLTKIITIMTSFKDDLVKSISKG